MSIKIFLSITALTTAVIGLTLLVFPSFVADFFLVQSAHGSDIFIRFLGSSLIGYTYLNWFTAQHNEPVLIRPALLGNFSSLVIALVISIWGVLSKTLKTTGVLIIVLHLVFAVGFGWYLYKIPILDHK